MTFLLEHVHFTTIWAISIYLLQSVVRGGGALLVSDKAIYIVGLHAGEFLIGMN